MRIDPGITPDLISHRRVRTTGHYQANAPDDTLLCGQQCFLLQSRTGKPD